MKKPSRDVIRRRRALQRVRSLEDDLRDLKRKVESLDRRVATTQLSLDLFGKQ